LVKKKLVKQKFFNRQRTKVFHNIETRDDVDDNVELNLWRREAISLRKLRVGILDG
jgi:hypothetical protein